MLALLIVPSSTAEVSRDESTPEPISPQPRPSTMLSKARAEAALFDGLPCGARQPIAAGGECVPRLGAAPATTSLTIPAALALGLITGQEAHLGLDGVDVALLVLTLFGSARTFGDARTNVLRAPCIFCCSWSISR